jgi:UDP-glucose 4-epimerase
MQLRSGVASVFNVCSGEATSILELAHFIGKLAGKHPNVNHIPGRPGDIRHSLGDPTSMRKVLGLSRTVPLHDGLLRLLAHGAEQQAQ